jgi:hypothetical protein
MGNCRITNASMQCHSTVLHHSSLIKADTRKLINFALLSADSWRSTMAATASKTTTATATASSSQGSNDLDKWIAKMRGGEELSEAECT